MRGACRSMSEHVGACRSISHVWLEHARCNAARCSSMQLHAARCSSMQLEAARCSSMQAACRRHDAAPVQLEATSQYRLRRRPVVRFNRARTGSSAAPGGGLHLRCGRPRGRRLRPPKDPPNFCSTQSIISSRLDLLKVRGLIGKRVFTHANLFLSPPPPPEAFR